MHDTSCGWSDEDAEYPDWWTEEESDLSCMLWSEEEPDLSCMLLACDDPMYDCEHTWRLHELFDIILAKRLAAGARGRVAMEHAFST